MVAHNYGAKRLISNNKIFRSKYLPFSYKLNILSKRIFDVANVIKVGKCSTFSLTHPMYILTSHSTIFLVGHSFRLRLHEMKPDWIDPERD